jgi:hypothetical protein
MLSTMVAANGNVMSVGVVSWWLFLCTVAVFNVATWSRLALELQNRRAGLGVEVFATARIQLVLSGVYLFGCAFRSVLPVYDIPRLCLFDTWLSDVLVGRSVATIAELAFASQWALLLYAAASASRNTFAKGVSLVIVPIIVTAEICSWYAVLTTFNLAHVAENSSWALAAALAIAAMLAMLPRCDSNRRRALFVWCMGGALYVAFMVLSDIPTYWARHVADDVLSRHYLTVAQGLADVSTRRVVSYRWEDWQSEIVWMTLYFSVGVWCSLSLINSRIPITQVRDAKVPPALPARRRAQI